MKTIKVIDLLNKIANGEKVPKKIIAGSEECEYFYDSEVRDYRNVKTKEKLFEDEIEQYIIYFLNDIVEIIEEPQQHKIERLEDSAFDDGNVCIGWEYNERKLKDKINEIIDYLEEIK